MLDQIVNCAKSNKSNVIFVISNIACQKMGSTNSIDTFLTCSLNNQITKFIYLF